MELNYLQVIVLHCLQQLGGERSTSSVLHLLNGKKSSQTIQDAHLFHLKRLFQTAPSLTREELDEAIEKLHSNQTIEKTAENYYTITREGEKLLNKHSKNKVLPPYVNGWKYHKVTTLFWERLSLTIQVCSHLINKERSYIPIQRNEASRQWVKQFIQTSPYSRSELTEKLLSELLELLSETTTINPNIVVVRLTGYQKIGLTKRQAADFLQKDVWEYSYEFINILHYLISKSEENPARYGFLAQLSERPRLPLTKSTEKTYELVKKGYTFAEIIAKRRLKKGTIEDHIIEIVFIDDQFEIDSFVTRERQAAIIHVIEQLETKQLKVIKEQVQEASYFEIRLTMAKYGDYK